MSKPASARSALLRATFGAALLTAAVTFGLLVDSGANREATDQSLTALLLTILPIATCWAIWRTDRAQGPLLAFGENRRKSALLRLAPLLWGLPSAMLVLAAVVLVWTRGPHDQELALDVVATAPVAIMAALSILLVALAACEWFGGVGLVVLLLVLVTLGQSELGVAAALPSAHVRHLLGVGATLPFDPGWSMAALWGFSLLGFSLWWARVPP